MGDFDGERKDLPNATAALVFRSAVVGVLLVLRNYRPGTWNSGRGTGLGSPQGLSGEPGAIHGSIL